MLFTPSEDPNFLIITISLIFYYYFLISGIIFSSASSSSTDNLLQCMSAGDNSSQLLSKNIPFSSSCLMDIFTVYRILG